MKQAEQQIEQKNFEINRHKTHSDEAHSQLSSVSKQLDKATSEIEKRDAEIRKLTGKISDFEVRIGQLNMEKGSYGTALKGKD